MAHLTFEFVTSSVAKIKVGIGLFLKAEVAKFRIGKVFLYVVSLLCATWANEELMPVLGYNGYRRY